MPVYLDARHLPEGEGMKEAWPRGTVYVEVDKDSSVLADAPLGSSVEVESREDLFQHFNKGNEFFVRAFEPSKDNQRSIKAMQVNLLRKYKDAVCVHNQAVCRPTYINELDSKGTHILVDEARKEAKNQNSPSIPVDFPWLRLSSLHHRCINSQYLTAPDKEDKPYDKPYDAWQNVLVASKLRNIILPYGIKATLNRNISILDVDDESYQEIVSKAKNVMSRQERSDKLDAIIMSHFDWSTSNRHEGRFQKILTVAAYPFRKTMDRFTGMEPYPETKRDNHRKTESEDIFIDYMLQSTHNEKAISKLFKNAIPFAKAKKNKNIIEAVNIFMKDLHHLHEGYCKLLKVNDASLIFGQRRRRGLVNSIHAYPYHHSGDKRGWKEHYMAHYIAKHYPGWEMYQQYKKYSDYIRSSKDANTMKWIQKCIELLDPIRKMKPI